MPESTETTGNWTDSGEWSSSDNDGWNSGNSGDWNNGNDAGHSVDTGPLPGQSILARAMAGITAPPDDAHEDAGAPADKADDELAGESARVPESPQGYTFQFQPETRVDTELLSGFQQWAHKNGLPLNKARELVGMYEKQMSDSNSQHIQRLADQQQLWRDSLEKNPEFMRNYESNMADIRRGLQAYQNPALMQSLAECGMAENPEIVKLFQRLGRELAEPASMRGGGGEKRRYTNDDLMREVGWVID